MKLFGLFGSPYVSRIARTMRLYVFNVEHVALSAFGLQREMRKINPMPKVPKLHTSSAYCGALPAFAQTSLE